MKAIRHVMTLTALAGALALPCSLMAGPIVVTINDVPNAAPVIKVLGAPNGYDIYTGEGIATPGVEDGALITLIGVNNYFEPDALPEWGGRFTDPTPVAGAPAAVPWPSLRPKYKLS